MKAYLGIKFHADNRNRDRIERISMALAACGYQCICVTRDVEEWGARHFSPQKLMNRTFAIIRECDISIIDLTEKGVGLGIEAGYAFALKKPLYTIAHIGSDISTTLKGISTQVRHYQEPDDLIEFFKQIEKHD